MPVPRDRCSGDPDGLLIAPSPCGTCIYAPIVCMHLAAFLSRPGEICSRRGGSGPLLPDARSAAGGGTSARSTSLHQAVALPPLAHQASSSVVPPRHWQHWWSGAGAAVVGLLHAASSGGSATASGGSGRGVLPHARQVSQRCYRAIILALCWQMPISEPRDAFWAVVSRFAPC